MQATDTTYKIVRIEELDGLRGLMAFWVVCTHILCWCGLAYINTPWPISRMWPDFVSAQPAVHTFIVLSGFAITFLMHHRAQSYPHFIVGRLFRLYPVYLFCLLLGLLTIPLTPFILQHAAWHGDPYLVLLGEVTKDERSRFLSHTLAHLTLLHGLVPKNVLPGVGVSILPPAWSISVEWQYYLLAFVIASLLRRGWGILCMAGVVLLSFHHLQPWLNPNIAVLPYFLPLFLLGIVSYHLYAWFCSQGAKRSDAYRLPVFGMIVIAAVLSSWSIAEGIWAIVFGSIFVEGKTGLTFVLCGLRRFLNRPVLQWLGTVSYPLYLIHWPIIVAMLALLLKCKPSLTPIEAWCWLTLVGLPCMLASAYVLHRTIELPFMRLGKDFARRERRERQTPPQNPSAVAPITTYA